MGAVSLRYDGMLRGRSVGGSVCHGKPPSKGPVPWIGESNVNRIGGDICVYIMMLEGSTPSSFEKSSSKSFLKIGITSDINRRVAELNQSFPPTLYQPSLNVTLGIPKSRRI
jgi:hypothetical protein